MTDVFPIFSMYQGRGSRDCAIFLRDSKRQTLAFGMNLYDTQDPRDTLSAMSQFSCEEPE